MVKIQKMKMAHKLMLLVGSVIVVAVVIVLIQLRTSAQLASSGGTCPVGDGTMCREMPICPE